MNTISHSGSTNSMTRNSRSRSANRNLASKTSPEDANFQQKRSSLKKQYDRIGWLNFRKIKRSAVFWNSLLIFPLGAIAYVDLRLLALVLAIGSIFSLGIIFDRYKRGRLWMLWMPTTWLIIAFLFVVWIFERAKIRIKKFNSYLDGE